MTKASAIIHTHAQKPYTVFGIPLRLVGLLFAGVGVVGIFMILLMLRYAWINNIFMPSLLISIALGCAWIIKLTKQDHHIETVLTLPSKFWRHSHKDQKIFVSGGNHIKPKPTRKRGKR